MTEQLLPRFRLLELKRLLDIPMNDRMMFAVSEVVFLAFRGLPGLGGDKLRYVQRRTYALSRRREFFGCDCALSPSYLRQRFHQSLIRSDNLLTVL